LELHHWHMETMQCTPPSSCCPNGPPKLSTSGDQPTTPGHTVHIVPSAPRNHTQTPNFMTSTMGWTWLCLLPQTTQSCTMTGNPEHPNIRQYFCPTTQQNNDLQPHEKPCYTAPVWVFFVCISHRVITLKSWFFWHPRAREAYSNEKCRKQQSIVTEIYRNDKSKRGQQLKLWDRFLLFS